MGRPKQTATRRPKVNLEQARATLARAIQEQQLLLKRMSITDVQPHSHSPVFERPCCCTCCDYEITMDEICAGFSQDNPLDVMTTCPACDGRFMATLMINGGAFVVALGPKQTLEQYRELVDNAEPTDSDKIAKNFFTLVPFIAWNAYWHSSSRDSADLTVYEKVCEFLELSRK